MKNSKKMIIAALGEPRLMGPAPEYQDVEVQLGPRDLSNLLASRLRENGATCLLTQDDAQTVETVADMLFKAQVDKVVLGTEAIIQEINLGERLMAKLPKMKARRVDSLQSIDSWEGVEHGITGCAALFADTGTVVMPAMTRLPLRASLLPSHHIVIARSTQIFEHMDSWLAALPPQARRLSWVSVAGPSRTADIEKRLVLGVHGPTKVTVLISVGQLFNFQK
jgi:L-lactate dehydrogenase complex protein LldG